MPPLMQLPGYNVELPDIAGAVAPVQNALMQNRAFGLQQERMGMDRERLGMERERFGLEKQRFGEQQQDAIRKRFGGLALLAMQEQDEAKRASLHQQLIGMHPAADKLPAHYRDPGAGLLAILGDAGMADDYLKFQIQQRQAALSAAADSRAAAMHPVQLRSAQIDLAAKQREFENPADAIRSVKDGETLLRMPKRPGGDAEVVFGPGMNGQPAISDPKKRAEIEHQLRGEITKLSTDYRTVRDASASLEGIGKNDTAAGDIALIFSYMKILDPNSVVRETEFATAQNATGVPDRVRNLWNRLLNGERLNPNQRQDFLNQARSISEKQLGQYSRTLDQYNMVAKRTGVDPRNVVLDQELMTPGGGTAVGNATIGTKYNGEAPPVMTPEQVRNAPIGTWFSTNEVPPRVLRKTK